jgi:hypothetical protein
VASQLLPQRVDNTYHGHKLALWLFGVVVFVKAAQSLVSIFNPRSVAMGPDGIPLGTYPSAAAQTVVSVFALLGFSYFVICCIGILVLVRYRRLVPFMFALLVADYLSRRLILYFLPIVRTGTPPGFYINLALLALMIAGLALSLRTRRERAGAAA